MPSRCLTRPLLSLSLSLSLSCLYIVSIVNTEVMTVISAQEMSEREHCLSQILSAGSNQLQQGLHTQIRTHRTAHLDSSSSPLEMAPGEHMHRLQRNLSHGPASLLV
eukprot:CAMPEP_0182421206 /NCGR_PEP_ID=MMETSP1167-20130531/6473_1 /TAXON_ID=2988 /ORGANISM="Mallomonas Sp, Strain CCMP3275" /LENGTH=106 /DNA_ID=CAMNT_0024598089 /DNA_START=310 /DNA_END=630 /DNA_ORIENTATION=+